PDQALPVGVDVVPVGNGQQVSYILRYENRGSATAKVVQVKAKAYGALRFASGSDTATFNLGDITAGVSSTLQIDGIINTALNGRSAELDITLSDALHGEFDWLWALHPVDSAAPQDLTIQGGDGYARPGVNTFSGFVSDPAGIARITLDVDGRTLDCPDPTPFDGAWSCTVDLGTLAGASQVSARARATDTYGNQSAFTSALILPVDLTPPGVALDPSVDGFLADGLIGPAEMQWRGSIQDNRVAAGLQVCTAANDPTSCSKIPITPGDAAQGAWSAALNTILAGDGAAATIALYGIDGAGNRARTPLKRSFRAGTIPPGVTATQQLDPPAASGR